MLWDGKRIAVVKRGVVQSLVKYVDIFENQVFHVSTTELDAQNPPSPSNAE